MTTSRPLFRRCGWKRSLSTVILCTTVSSTMSSSHALDEQVSLRPSAQHVYNFNYVDNQDGSIMERRTLVRRNSVKKRTATVPTNHFPRRRLSDYREDNNNANDDASSHSTSTPTTSSTISPRVLAMRHGLVVYTNILVLLVASWVVYLLLPKAVRKAYCRADRRRYLIHQDMSSSTSNGGKGVNISIPHMNARDLPRSRRRVPSSVVSSSVAGSSSVSYYGETSTMSLPDAPSLPQVPPPNTNLSSNDPEWQRLKQQHLLQQVKQARLERHHQQQGQGQSGQPIDSATSRHNLSRPSPLPPPPTHEIEASSFAHPDLLPSQIPSSAILQETLHRLQSRGVRLMAHGVQCQPKRVWIRYHNTSSTTQPPDSQEAPTPSLIGVTQASIVWQTEFPKSIPNSNGDRSVVWMRGKVHPIPMTQILTIAIGHTTAAFVQQPSSDRISPNVCWSILTMNGSLDLQANSQLERNALVCCMAHLMDRHDPTWRHAAR